MANNKTAFHYYKPSEYLAIQLDFERQVIEMQIDYYKEYINDHKKLIEKRQTEFSKKVKKALSDREDLIADGFCDETDVFDDVCKDEKYNMQEFHNQLFYKSTFISSFSYFESQFKGLCKLVEGHTNFPISVNEMKGSDIEQAKTYLQKVFKVDFEEFRNQWEKLREYQKVRNCIVHNNSKLKENEGRQEDLKRIISKSPALKCNDGDNIIVIADVKFLLDFNDDAITFLSEIFRKTRRAVLEVYALDKISLARRR